MSWFKVALMAALAIGLAASFAAAQSPPSGSWIADPRSGCRVHNPRPVPNESIQWTGGCQGGLAQGRGALQWFLQGQPTSRTEGEWQRGVLNGRALTLNPDGSRHEGEYRNGLANGRGVTTFPNGNRLDVSYVDGKANGRGVLTLGDGSGKLDADFVDDQGVSGVWEWKNGNRYQGTLKNLLPDGKGKMSQKNGTTYEGDFKAGNWEGQAVVHYAVGDVYEGAWKGLYPNGRGTLHRKSGTFSGIWTDGCLSNANSDNGLWATSGKSAAECGFR